MWLFVYEIWITQVFMYEFAQVFSVCTDRDRGPLFM